LRRRYVRGRGWLLRVERQLLQRAPVRAESHARRAALHLLRGRDLRAPMR
jgi:hypothetical protein